MVVRNYSTDAVVPLPGPAALVLDLFSEWSSVAEATRRLGLLSPAAMRRVCDGLHRQGLLLRSDEPEPAREKAFDALEDWNPAVGFFHSATRDVPFVSADQGRAEQQVTAETRPWAGEAFQPPGRRLALPVPDLDSAVARACLRRRSWRRFGRRRVTRHELASLLWLTGGIPRWAVTGLGEFPLKTSPSGGALHPVEIYVLARTVRGLAPGFYHYSGREHALRLLRRHAATVPIERYLPHQPWFGGASAVLFLTAHYDRCLWRYQYPRAYRAPFIEAGHLAQTFCVRATEMGLAPFVSMALSDSAIEREIGADGVIRSALYATGVGTRPAGVSWAPEPDRRHRLTVRENDVLRGRKR